MVLPPSIIRKGWAMACATPPLPPNGDGGMTMVLTPSRIRKGWAMAFTASHCSRMGMEGWP